MSTRSAVERGAREAAGREQDWDVSRNQGEYPGPEGAAERETLIYRSLRHCWHPVLYSDELGDTPQRVTLCGQDVVVVRLDGVVRAFNDLCAHRGTALSRGTVVDGADGQQLRCPYHGWQYDSEGRCALAPQRPDLAGRLRARVRRYRCEERHGLIWLCLVDEPRFPIPAFPEWDDDGYDKVVIPSDTWACSAPRRAENYFDLGHFAIVHDGILGDADHPEAPEHEVWRETTALRMRTAHAKLEPWETKFDEEPPDAVDGLVATSQEWWVYMPLTVTFHQQAPGDRHYVLFFHPTPVGPKTTRNFTLAATRNLGGRQGKGAGPMIEFMQVIYDQDKPVVESQRPEELAEDLSEEIYLHGVDTLSVQYRRWLLDLAHELGDVG